MPSFALKFGNFAIDRQFVEVTCNYFHIKGRESRHLHGLFMFQRAHGLYSGSLPIQAKED